MRDAAIEKVAIFGKDSAAEDPEPHEETCEEAAEAEEKETKVEDAIVEEACNIIPINQLIHTHSFF